MNRGERKRIVLNRVDLSLENGRGEVITARNRQTGIMQAVSQVMGKLETMTAGTDDDCACLVAGVPGFYQKTAPVYLDMCDVFVEMQVDLLVGNSPGLTNEGA